MTTPPATDWSLLTHAYGPADDIPGLFARLDGGPGDEGTWQALWSSLCHQGSTYSASFAALPVLADIAAGRVPGGREDAVSLAGCIVAEAEDDDMARYADEIAELLAVTRACLAELPVGDPKEYIYLTQFELAFEGVLFWSSELEPMLEEYEAECPACGDFTPVMLGEYLDDCEASLHPAAPAELTGIGARLHTAALAAGQTEVAESLLRLFGRVTCMSCETVFGIAESAVED